MKKSVSFADLTIHSFGPCIGNSPFVSVGVPIALGDKLSEKAIPIDDYEKQRLPRRSGKGLAIDRRERIDILIAEGYGKEEITDAILDAYYTRKAIAESVSGKKWDKFNEKVESTTRVLSKLVGLKNTSKVVLPHETSNPKTGKRTQSARGA